MKNEFTYVKGENEKMTNTLNDIMAKYRTSAQEVLTLREEIQQVREENL